jgi:hypothetical protein
MFFSYSYGWWQNQRWHWNVPSSQPILKVLQMCQCYAVCIAQCSMSRATPEATGCCPWATNLSILPRRLPGWQQTKQRWKNAPTLLAILMAAAVCRYNAALITRWRRSRALVEATGCCHQASIAADSCNRSHIRHFFLSFFIVNL